MGKGNQLNTHLQHLLVSAVNAVLKIQKFCQKKPYSAIRVSNLSTEVKRQKWKLWYMILNWVKILVLSYFFKNDGKHFNVELYQSYFTLFIEKNLHCCDQPNTLKVDQFKYHTRAILHNMKISSFYSPSTIWTSYTISLLRKFVVSYHILNIFVLTRSEKEVHRRGQTCYWKIAW